MCLTCLLYFPCNLFQLYITAPSHPLIIIRYFYCFIVFIFIIFQCVWTVPSYLSCIYVSVLSISVSSRDTNIQSHSCPWWPKHNRVYFIWGDSGPAGHNYPPFISVNVTSMFFSLKLPCVFPSKFIHIMLLHILSQKALFTIWQVHISMCNRLLPCISYHVYR